MLKTIPIIAFSLLAASCATIKTTPANPPSNYSMKNTVANTNPVSTKNGLITVESHYSVKETADRFESIAQSKGLTLFARINHQKNAAGVDLELKPTEVIIFGNPKAGTALMQCVQTVAIDLPQKVLISQDSQGTVRLTYNDPQYLKARHNIKGCDKVINNMSMLLSSLSTATTSK